MLLQNARENSTKMYYVIQRIKIIVFKLNFLPMMFVIALVMIVVLWKVFWEF